MVRTLGIVTIGQAPRDDIADLFAAHAPAGTKVILRGALDGLSDAEVDALQPENGGDTLYTRLRGGRDVKISKKAVIARSPAALDRLRGDGCDVIQSGSNQNGQFPHELITISKSLMFTTPLPIWRQWAPVDSVSTP